VKRLVRRARRQAERVLAHHARVRLALVLLRLRVSAAWNWASVEIDVAPDLRLGRGVRFTVDPRTHTVLRIGARSRLDDRVLVLLKGGRIDLGEDTWLRRDVILNVSGHLQLVRNNVLSWGVVVHCAESVRLEPMASAAEAVTVADSTHFFTEPDAFFYHNTRTAPIVVGANTWLCPKVTVTPDVTIGSHCIIASNSVVIADVPDGHLASGVPARVVKALPLPWKDGG
jgi:acetyltransferase-like isoleucine patch superfamily enzyme